MARRLRNPTNPRIFGVELVDALWMAAGAGLTGFVNDRLVAPVAKRLVPPVYSGSQLVAKLADAFTTFASAWAVGAVAGMVSRPVGGLMHLGGGVLAGGRVISAFIPGYQLSAEVPFSIQGLSIPVLQPTQTPALPPSGATQAVASQQGSPASIGF